MNATRNTKWPQVVAGGALWAAVYNFVRGLSWFAFMRQEWLRATASIHMAMPWTAEVWSAWTVFTVPIGMAMAAYTSANTGSTLRAAVLGGIAVWLLLALGMAIWCTQASLPMRITALDSGVNLVGIVSASLITGWSRRPGVA